MSQQQSSRAWALSDEVRAVQANPRDFWAWIRLYLVVDTVAYKRVCLERALAIEPGNEGARWLLARLEA